MTSGDCHVNIIGIDPGTVTLGLSIMTVNCVTCNIIKTETLTINAVGLVKASFTGDVEPNAENRIALIKKALINVFNEKRPIAIASESAFYNTFRPGAFKQLLTVMRAIREAVKEYNEALEVEFIDPPNVKIAIGAKGNAGKEAVQKSVQALIKTGFFGDINTESIDEHGFDSLGVITALYKRML